MAVFQQMRVVLAVAEHGSLTAAAHHLGLSLPSVVRVLAGTEERLGVRLFDRTTRRIHITEEGAMYADTCRSILGEMNEIEDTLRDRRIEPQGVLAITAPILFGRMHVAPVLSDFLRNHPKVNARLLLLDRVVDLFEEGIDVAVRIGPVTDPGLVAVPVGQVRRCVCAAPALLKRLPKIRSPEALADTPFIQLLGLMPAAELKLPPGTAKRPVVLRNVRLVTNHGDAAIEACRSGLGAGIFLSYQVQEFIQSGELKPLLPAVEFEPLPVSLVYEPSRRLPARTRLFIDWAKESLAARLVKL